MSHVDSFQHEIVGRFAGLPVYHPLEVIDGDFHCTPNQLVLGGGSGEHPALVVAQPQAAVACFLDTELAPQRGVHVTGWKPAIEQHLDYNHGNNLVFHDWSIADFANFDARCRSSALLNPYDDGLEMSVEHWLVLGFGEFVFFAMPELASELMDSLDDPYRHFRHERYNNIQLIPPNMPVYANGGNAFVSSRRRQEKDR